MATPDGGRALVQRACDIPALIMNWLDVRECRGCGLCASGSKAAPIDMLRVGESVFESYCQR